jgi:ATP-dependent DNA helicase RecQ
MWNPDEETLPVPNGGVNPERGSALPHAPSPAASAPAGDDPQRILAEVFGYPSFRGAQRAIIDCVIGGDDALVLMPTGGGKSLCYQIPALARPGCGVVVSPLIALMQDQVAALRQSGVRAAALNSAQPAADLRAAERALVAGELDLVYIAPERLVLPRTLELLEQCSVALFAIDEAHCVSQWGHDFRPEYIQLAVLAERFPTVPRLALTATADGPTRREIVSRWDCPGRGSSSAGSTGRTSATASPSPTPGAAVPGTACCASSGTSTPARPASSTASRASGSMPSRTG